MRGLRAFPAAGLVAAPSARAHAGTCEPRRYGSSRLEGRGERAGRESWGTRRPQGRTAVSSDDRLIRVVSESHAGSTIAELVRALSPARGSDEAGVPEPAGTSPRDEGSR